MNKQQEAVTVKFGGKYWRVVAWHHMYTLLQRHCPRVRNGEKARKWGKERKVSSWAGDRVSMILSDVNTRKYLDVHRPQPSSLVT